MYRSLQVLHNQDAHAAYVYGDDSFLKRIHHDDPLYDDKMKTFITRSDSIEEYNLFAWADEPPRSVSDVPPENLEFIGDGEAEDLSYIAAGNALAYGIGVFAAIAINHEYIFGEDSPTDPFGFI